MSKIAPVTMALLADLRAKVKPGKAGAGDAQVLRIVEAEVKSMRAVVRAADRLVHDAPFDLSDIDEAMVLDRALARLSRAGRGRK